jgi:hypothetical protein
LPANRRLVIVEAQTSLPELFPENTVLFAHVR